MKKTDQLKKACKNYEEDLVLYYYGENSADERRHVEQHLTECVCCQSFVADLRRLLPRMTPTETLPQSFWDNYYRETVRKLAEQEERKSWWGNLFVPMRSWMVPAFGTAAVAILAIALVVGKGKLTSFIERSPTTLPQEVLADDNQLEFFKSLDMLESLSHLEEKGDGQVNPQPTHSNSEKIEPVMA
ncbi:MAG TPA: hypothetical protein VNT76_02465 [Candidatus Binatus sp.]|nr:hypothetical protein [Candidatus Binatus sp.]